MPVYTWKGLDAQGMMHEGTACAPTEDTLRERLLEKGIGLFQARAALRASRISIAEQHQFLNHLATLILSHIPLHAALIIIAATLKKRPFKAIIEDVALLISQGMALSDALAAHHLSDELTSTVIRMSEKTGALGPALQALAEHRASMGALKEKVRSALVGPAITFFFFLIIMLAIFILVMPQFEHYFLSYNAPLPAITAAMLAISRALRSPHALWVLAGIILALIGLVQLVRTSSGRRMRDELVFKIPGYAFWMRKVYRVRLLKTLGMLLEQGVPLAQAFEVCIETTQQAVVGRHLLSIKESVEEGVPLSVAWRASIFSCPETEAFITMGESSGRLGMMLDRAGSGELTSIYTSLQRGAALLQPVLLFFLGILVACLLIAVYMPLLTLSELLV